MSIRVGVIGAGAWGTALASVMARAGRDVHLWGRNAELVNVIDRRRENPRYLPGIELPENIHAVAEVGELGESDIILLVTPTQSVRVMSQLIEPYIQPETPIVLCCKGIERDTGNLVSDIVKQQIPQAVPAVLSGPSFAHDVARGLPTAITIAAYEDKTAKRLAMDLGHATFRPYASTDMVGVQIGGALKNVLAIACGIASGRELGASAVAALTARGFAEMSRIGEALGARPETLMGLSGLGDLVLTCSGPQSRNFAYGLAIGRSEPPPKKLAEGAHTASIAVAVASVNRVDAPICRAVRDVLDDDISVDRAIERLLARPFKAESV